MEMRARLPAALLLVGLFAHVATAQGRPATVARPRRDATVDLVRAAEPPFADSATRRLEILTEIWGNTGLYHPAPYTRRLKWDDVLISALGEMRNVRTDRDLIDVLNRVVFAPLDDPLTFAMHRADAVRDLHQPVSPAWLGDSTVYIDGSAHQWLDVSQLRALLDSLARVRPVRAIVFDLRYERRPSFWLIPPLNPWLREPTALGPDISLLHTTEDRLGDPKMLVSPRDTMHPAAYFVATPTVFVVSRSTYPVFERVLDAIRWRRRDVAVVFEETGTLPDFSDQLRAAWYPDSILLSTGMRRPIVAADGALGSVADMRRQRPVAVAELAAVAESALAARVRQRPRPALAFTAGGFPVDPVSRGPLSREQRLAGLLKFWFYLKTFYAYPDDITGDWNRALVYWVPEVEKAETDSAYYRALRRMSVMLNDTHLQLTHPLAGEQSLARRFVPPLKADWIDHRLLITRLDTAATDVGLARGDEILTVDGVPLRSVIAEERQFWSFTNPYGGDLPVFTFLSGERGSTVRLGVRTRAGIRNVALPRSRPGPAMMAKAVNHPAYELLPGNIGYMDLTQIQTAQQFDSARTALAATRGLVLDRRGGAESDFAPLVAWLTSEPTPWLRRMWSVSYMGTDGEYPVRATAALPGWTVPDWTDQNPLPLRERYTNPVVLLTGANVSHNETLAVWLRLAKRATLVGQPTSGTLYSADVFTLPGGARVLMTRVRVVWPDGSRIHRTGVVPDVLVAPTAAGVRAGRDEVYEAGLATLRRLIRP